MGDRDVYPVDFDFPAGSVVHQFIDAETYLPIKVVVKINVPGRLGARSSRPTSCSTTGRSTA